jgi:hypothetical protein
MANGTSIPTYMVKITTVLDSKPTKSIGRFEENKFSVGCHQFLLECCPKLIKTYNFGQNAANKRQLKNKNQQYCAVKFLFSKLLRLFVNFSSAIVRFYYRVSLADPHTSAVFANQLLNIEPIFNKILWLSYGLTNRFCVACKDNIRCLS